MLTILNYKRASGALNLVAVLLKITGSSNYKLWICIIISNARLLKVTVLNPRRYLYVGEANTVEVKISVALQPITWPQQCSPTFRMEAGRTIFLYINKPTWNKSLVKMLALFVISILLYEAAGKFIFVIILGCFVKNETVINSVNNFEYISIFLSVLNQFFFYLSLHLLIFHKSFNED